MATQAAAPAIPLVDPKVAYEAVAAKRGVLVDVRQTDDGFLLLKNTFRLPYESILGPVTGFEVVPGPKPTRAEMLAQVKESDLDSKEYHYAGELALDRVQSAANDKTLDHAGAQAYLRNILRLTGDLPAFADQFMKETMMEWQASMDYIKDMVDQGKPTREVDDYLTSVRTSFQRFIDLKPHTFSRFDSDKKYATDAERDDADFVFRFLGNLKPVFGRTCDHKTAIDLIKKRIKPDTLKDNKTFLDFYIPFNREHTLAVSEVMAELGRKSTNPTPEQAAYIQSLHTGWAWYLNYSPTPTKEQLAAHISDHDLEERAGRFLANFPAPYLQRTRELAKEALKTLPAERPLYLICLAQAHSERVGALLVEAGAGDVRIVKGGVDRWMSMHLPCDYTPAMQAKIDETYRNLMRGAPTGLAEIND